MQGERIATTILTLVLLTAITAAQTLPSAEQEPATQATSAPLAVETAPDEKTLEPATQPATSAEPVPAPEAPPAVTPPEGEAPASAPTAAAPSPAPIAAETTEPAEKARNIRFQFENVPFTRVITRFSQMTGRPLVGDARVEGELTFIDAEPYTYDEALDTLNMLLAMRGFALMESGRYLRLVPLAQVQQMPLKILKGLDQTEGVRPGQIVTVLVPMKYIDSNEAAKMVVRMVSTFGSISPMVKGKGIVITDTLENIRRIRALLSEMDTETIVEKQFKACPLRHASAKTVAEIIGKLFGSQGGGGGGRYYDREQRRWVTVPDTEKQGTVNATCDERTNMVLLVGSGDQLALAEQLIEKLDAAGGLADGEIRIFSLTKARAEDLAKTVLAALPKQTVQQGRRSVTVSESRVVADAGTNRLIVSAAVDQMAQIEKLIRELDAATETGGGAKVFRLKFADAGQLAGILATAISERDARGRSRPKITATAESRSNSLIVAGDAGDIQTAAQLIAEFDRPPDASTREIHVVQLKAGDARQIARALSSLFAQQSQGRRGQGASDSLRVEADEAGNSLLISASPGDWPIVQDLLQKLQAAVVPAATVATRLVPLQHARADELAVTLRQVYDPQRSRRRDARTTPVVIAASERSNSLLISAAADDQQALGELIAALDVPPTEKVEEIRMVRLSSADAATLVGKLQAMLPPARKGEQADVSMQYDKLTNSILLRAPQGKRQMLEEIIAKIDQATQAQARETRLVNLKHTSAAALAQTLGELYRAPAARKGQRQGSEVESDAVIVSPAPGDRTLVLDAPRDRMEQIAALVATLDAEPAPGTLQVRTYDLANAAAGEIARSLEKLFTEQSGRSGRRATGEPQPRFDASAATNQLLVAATAEQFAEIEKLIEQIKAATVLSGQTRTFRLKHAKADDIAQVLGQMLPDAPAAAGSSRRGRQAADSTVRVAPLPAANAVVVQGPPAKLTLAEELIGTFDTAEASGTAVIQVVELKNAEARSLAESINQALGAKAGKGAPPADLVTVTPESNSNSVLIRGPAARVAETIAMVRKLDADATASDVQVRVYPLTNSDAGELAKSVEKLFVDLAKRMPKNRRDAGVPPFSVTADARTNSLVVSTTGGYFTIVEQLLQNLDRAPERIEADAQYIWLENADAFDVASKLQEMYRDRRGADKPVIEADSFSNAITLIAKDTDLKAMETIIAKLDAAARDNNIQVRVIPMTKMSADKMAEVLRRVYGQMTTSKIVITDGQPNPRFREPTSVESGNLRHEFSPTTQGADTTTAPADGGKLFNPETPAVTISVDKRSNSLIVSATRRELERIQSLIDRLAETAEEVEAEYRVFKITQADPAAVANSLEELFNPKVARQPAPAQPAQRGQRPQPQPQPPAPPPVITVVADARTRSVIVRAKTMDFEIIEPLIRHLDQVSTVVSEVRVFPLKNTDATETAASLRELFRMSSSQTPAPNQRQQPQGRGARATAQQQRAEVVRQVIELRRKDGVAQVDATTMVSISANRQANSVVVTAPADAMEVITSLIEELDQSAAQATATTVWMCPLKHAQAPAVATALSQAFAPPRGRKLETGEGVTVVAEPTSNTVIVTANAENLKKVQDLIARLDTETDQATGVYILALSSGDASEVASMIQSLYNQQLSAARRDKKSVPPLAVSADTRANAVVLATSKEMYEQVRQWVGEVEKMKPARGTLRVLTVEYADPAEVQKAIDQLFGPQGAAGSRGRGGRSGGGNPSSGNPAAARGGKVETTLLANQKAIMVSASDEDFQTIQQLIATLDEAAKGTQREVRVFTLVNASNALVANALGSMYRQVTRGAQPQDQVTVTALNQTTAVVVSAPKNRMEEVAHLIEQLDRKEVAAQVEFRIYPLTHAQPTKILPALRQMLQQVTRARPGESIDVQADERTRSLIVTARGAVFDEVAKVIAVLDKAPAYEKAEVLILPLKKADAAQLASVLTEMLRPSEGNQVTPEAKALQEQVRLLNVRSVLQDRIPELDLTKPIKIQADSAKPQGSNALIVTSTPDNLKAMAAIVEVLDTVPISEGVKVRMLHLSNADATSVAQVLREIFTQGRQLAGKPGTSVAGKAEPVSSSGKALVNVLNVSADPRTNTVVLSGLEESLALAELIVKDLDRQEGQFVTDVRAFKLKNAAADRMAPILRAVFAEGAAQPGANGLRAQVTRLRIGRKKELLSELPRAREALTIQADADTNILLIAARSDIMPLIVDVITTMDIPGAGSLNTVRIYPLENADATRISQVLQSLYAGPNAKLVRDEDKPTVAVDTRTNALVVSASEKTFLLLEALLKNLDSKTPIELRDIRLVPLKNTDAAVLATVLQKMMDARVQRQQSLGARDAEALRVILLADERSNSLIVGGSPESFQLVEELASKLDVAEAALGGQVQLIPLTEANAGTLATTLAGLFDQRYQAARTPELRRQKPIILPDLRINALLVAANADDSKVLRGLLEKLDVKLTDPAVQLVVIPLKHNDAGVVGPTIQQIFTARLASMTATGAKPSPQDRVDVATDALSNALIVSASKENLTLIAGLLEKVDIEPPLESGLVKMYGLNYADAGRVASMLQSLLANGLYKPGAAVAANAALTAREKVAIASDMRTNVLIVSASKENLAIIDEIVRRMDADVAPLLGDLRIYPLRHADATRLGPMLQQFFNEKRQAELAVNNTVRIVPLVVVADARTNTLLVAGGKENFAAVEAMIEKLDAAEAMGLNEFRLFKLVHATAGSLQPMLQKLFDQRVTRGQTKDPVTILADTRSNTLVVGASPEDMKLVESILARMDVAEDKAGRAQRVFLLEKADATQVANTLKELFKGQAGEAGVSIGVDERINAIVVSAGRTDLERIAELVAQFDTEKVTHVTEIRVFTLGNADATELGQILTDALTNKPKAMTARSQNLQTWLRFVATSPDGKELVTSALQEGVLITPDPRTNSLVVSAPRSSMPLLASMIQSLDMTSPRTAEIRVFTLTNADATQMADVLRAMFRQSAQGAAGGKTVKAVNYTLASATTQPADGATTEASATVGSAEQEALNITVDSRTNSLLVGGTRQYVQLAAKIIEELDSSPAQERVTKIYRLRNALATDIEKALRAFLDQERQRIVSTLGAQAVGAAQRLLEREVAVVSVGTEGQTQNTNTLLLSASPRYFQTIEEMIKELDQPPPQVLVQVLLAEITLDDTTDLGFEWTLEKKVENSTVQTHTNFSVAAAIAKSDSGLGISVTGGDLNFFLRALQSQGKLEVLSRPQILASDNQKATINVGQRVPFITNSRVTESGTTLNTIQYEPVGIILDVTPRINPDGFVRLEVAPQISSLSTSSVDISEGVKAIIVNERKAETTITVQDGHTVVLGGLITTRDENRESKVPVLGDIPLVGNLFKSTKVIKERTELLVILTPRVLRTIPQADAEAVKQLRRLNAQQAEVREGMRNDLIDLIRARSSQMNEDRWNWEELVPTPQSAEPPPVEVVPLRSLSETETNPDLSTTTAPKEADR